MGETAVCSVVVEVRATDLVRGLTETSILLHGLGSVCDASRGLESALSICSCASNEKGLGSTTRLLALTVADRFAQPVLASPGVQFHVMVDVR